MDVDAPFEVSYKWEIDRKFSDLEREGRDFQEVVYERNIVNADCTLEMDFSSLDRNRSESRSSRSYSERIQDGYNTEVDTSGNRIQVPRYLSLIHI